MPEDVSKQHASIFDMKTYLDNSMNIALAMSAVALAIMVYSDTSRHKVLISIVGFCLIILAIGIPLISSLDFIRFLGNVLKDESSLAISYTSLILTIILYYAYFGLMVLIAIVLLYKKIFKKKRVLQ